jgi:hypothetical protein
MSQLCKIFDYVFVDQRIAAAGFRKEKINAQWLPLCVQSYDFIGINDKKIYDIIFVGNTSQYRRKRNNLLSFLKQYFNIAIFQNIPANKMIKMFSQAKIVLNENLFNGMTLRVLQGLASGSLVVTEDGGDGIDAYFKDGEHIICYNHNNIIKILDKILVNYDSYYTVALNGFHACREYHTSEARAYDLMKNIGNGTSLQRKPCEEAGKYYETKARYLLRMRFGGSMRTVISGLESIANAGKAKAAESLLELGNIAARKGELEKAELFYRGSMRKEDAIFSYLKIALLYAHKGDLQKSKNALAKAALKIPCEQMLNNKNIIDLLEASTEKFEILFIIANFYYICDRIFSVGFLKQFADNFPDTALEIAYMAWNIEQLPVIMDFIIKCSKEYDVESDLLPILLDAIKNCQLSDRQILYTAELAKRCYEFDLAGEIVSSFKKTLRG